MMLLSGKNCQVNIDANIDVENGCHIMDGGHTNHYDVSTYAELNNKNKEEEKLEKEKRDRKEMELHEPDAHGCLDYGGYVGATLG